MISVRQESRRLRRCQNCLWVPTERRIPQTIKDSSLSLRLVHGAAWNVIEDRDLRGQLRARYVHGPKIDEILLREGSDGAKLYPLADGLGSTVALTDARGSVTHRFRYDAYGTPAAFDAGYAPVPLPTTPHRFLFTGREWLGIADLQDNRHRVYAAPLGRWLQVDPIGFGGGDPNLSRYTNGNPANHVDPHGLACECPSGNWSGTVFLSYIVGGFGGGAFSGTVQCDGSAASGASISGPVVAGGLYSGLGIELRDVSFSGAKSRSNLVGKQHSWLVLAAGPVSVGGGDGATLGIGFAMFGIEVASAL